VSALPTPVLPESTRESLGGRWATSLAVWLVLLPPALVLSAFQEIGVRYPTLLIGALACVAQCAASAVVIVIARLLRRPVRTISLLWCAVFWASVGIVHGVVAGILASVFAGADPQYVARAVFWAGAALIWLPLSTYATAQFASRRGLLTQLQTAADNAATVRRDSLWEIAELRALIVSAIRDNIRPVLVEIAQSIESIGPVLDAGRLADLGARLSGVSEETSRIIETTSTPAMSPEAVAIQPSAPLAAGLDFDRSRPVMATLLTCVALLPLTVAISFGSRDAHPEGLGTTALVLVAVAISLVLCLAALRFARRVSSRARVWLTLAAYFVAGFIAAAAAAAGPWQPANQQNLILAVLLPIAVPLAASTLSAAVGLGNANLGIVRQIAEIDSELTEIESDLEIRRREIRNQVAAFTHGPLRGRLAACAMALNFHAAEIGSTTPARTEYITTSVLEHLSSAMDELDALGQM